MYNHHAGSFVLRYEIYRIVYLPAPRPSHYSHYSHRAPRVFMIMALLCFNQNTPPTHTHTQLGILKNKLIPKYVMPHQRYLFYSSLFYILKKDTVAFFCLLENKVYGKVSLTTVFNISIDGFFRELQLIYLQEF